MNIALQAQVTNQENSLTNKYYSKLISLYKSKHFLFSDVLKTTDKVTKVEIIPLAAANSGELTTLLYKSEERSMEGLVLGFYNDYATDFNAARQAYAFKNLPKDKAMEFLSKISTAIDEYKSYLREDYDNNNIFFKYDDIEILVSRGTYEMEIRIFWNGYDATWERTAFDRSKRRFERKMK